MSEHTRKVLLEVEIERYRQDKKWGKQNHPDGTSTRLKAQAKHAKEACVAAAKGKYLTWRDILNEEVAEAFCEVDSEKLRAELVQVAAVAVAWIETLDSRKTRG